MRILCVRSSEPVPMGLALFVSQSRFTFAPYAWQRRGAPANPRPTSLLPGQEVSGLLPGRIDRHQRNLSALHRDTRRYTETPAGTAVIFQRKCFEYSFCCAPKSILMRYSETPFLTRSSVMRLRMNCSSMLTTSPIFYTDESGNYPD